MAIDLEGQQLLGKTPGNCDVEIDLDTIDGLLISELQDIPERAVLSPVEPMADASPNKATVVRKSGLLGEGARQKNQKTVVTLACLSMAAVLPLVFALDIPTTYGFHQGWKWRAQQDVTIRRAFLRGRCHQRPTQSQESCLEAQLRRYAPPASEATISIDEGDSATD